MRASSRTEIFGPVLCIVRYAADRLDELLDAIDATGYGLTLGIHSRIEATQRRIAERLRIGNTYINRNQIGAVVGVQPFGGRGLSGTGPKAGGPITLYRFAEERVCPSTPRRQVAMRPCSPRTRDRGEVHDRRRLGHHQLPCLPHRAGRDDSRPAPALRGLVNVPDNRFADTLREEIGPWLAVGEDHVLLSGMIGSRQGWKEAPYLPCPAGAPEVAAGLVEIEFDWAQVKLVPGLSATDEAGVAEVMRGEETQVFGVLGAMGGSGLACLPGTHSKWVRVEGGRIIGFTTHMTGEAFGALRGHTILGRMMREGPRTARRSMRACGARAIRGGCCTTSSARARWCWRGGWRRPKPPPTSPAS